MQNARTITLRSVEELRAAAPAWDDLWRRSATTYPTVRAEMVAQWIERFAPRANFTSIVVEIEGRYAAALPLMIRKLGGVFRAGALPCNEWTSSGDLLWDETVRCRHNARNVVGSFARRAVFPPLAGRDLAGKRTLA